MDVAMRRYMKFLAAIMLLFLTAVTSSCAEVEETAADDVTALQMNISNDIGRLRETIGARLSGMKLSEKDISRRLKELSALSETVSDDMAAWGYTEEQREKHTQLLSELTVAYTAYITFPQQTPPPETPQQPANAGPAGINDSDALRKEINKVSRGLDIQVFYLQSKLNKLMLDLAEVERLQKEEKDDKAGIVLLKLPRTHDLELENKKLNVALSSLQVRTIRQTFDQNVALIARLKRRLAGMTENLVFPEETLNANLKQIQDRIDLLTEEMAAARKALDSATSSAVRASAALKGRGAADIKAQNGLPTPALSLYLARSARVSYWETMTFMIDDEISLLREAQQVWRERYKLFRDEATGDDIWKYRDNAEKRMAELQRQLVGIRTMEEDLIRRMDSMRKQTEEPAGGDAEQKNDMPPEDRIKSQQNMLQAIENYRRIISDISNRYESMIPDMMFLQQRLYAEASDRVSAIRIAEKVQSFSRETILGFLNTELWKGEGYSVTVWRLVVAVIVFLSSFFLSSLGSRWIKRRMLLRFNASETAANATQRIIFYVLWITFALIALNIVEIPLTAFAFMGGAIAVGLGFGMQNLFNNLISGFIVIFSRPFKVNDIISIAETEGTVEDIGSRSTTIRTWDGLDVVLPNRYFLENSVTNWTGSDLKRRNSITVAVSYDSDTRQVEDLLLKVAKSHSKVLKDPSPFVIFKNFGDSSLEFEVYFWVDLKQASVPKVSSDMRHHIISLFREEGVEIPFPQMDVHLVRRAAKNSVAAEEDAAAPVEGGGEDKPNLPA